jgi:hypothetical protein
MNFTIKENPNQKFHEFRNKEQLKAFLKQHEYDSYENNFRLVSLHNNYSVFVFDIRDFSDCTTKTIFFDSIGECGIIELSELADFQEIYPCKLIEIEANDFHITVDVKV